MDFGTGDYFCTVGAQVISVNPWELTPNKSIKLNERITEARVKNSPYGKVPPKQDEKKEDWIKRVEESLKEDDKQRQGESAEAFLKRMYSPTSFQENLDYMFDCLKAIAEEFGKGNVVTKDNFGDSSILEINNFIARVLTKAKVPTEFTIQE